MVSNQSYLGKVKTYQYLKIRKPSGGITRIDYNVQ